MTDTLHCEQVPLPDLAAAYGTPLYVYSTQALTDALGQYQHAFAALNPLICYAVKANSNLSILRHFARLGCGFDIVSGGELVRVLAAGGSAAKTIFSGVGKSVAEIEYALQQGVRCFNVESLPELDRINAVAARLGKTAPISLRINPDVDAQTHPYISTGLKANKFGIAFADAPAAYQHAAGLPHLRITGIDCHIGSQLTNLSPLVEALERLLVLVDALAAQGIVLQHIDIGGGVGIVYDNEEVPDLAAYAQAVAERLFYYTAGYPFLVSKLCKIFDEKMLPEKTERTWTVHDVDVAARQLAGESNTNFDELSKNLDNNEDLYQLTQAIAIGGEQYPFNVNDPVASLGKRYRQRQADVAQTNHRNVGVLLVKLLNQAFFRLGIHAYQKIQTDHYYLLNS